MTGLGPAQSLRFDPSRLSPTVLAYIGDAVFELFIRTAALQELLNRPHAPGQPPEATVKVRALHLAASPHARADGQARLLHLIWPFLDEGERVVARRGRNCRKGRHPVRGEALAHRHSTGLEALLGHLYLSGRTARVWQLLSSALANVTERAGDGRRGAGFDAPSDHGPSEPAR